MTAPLTAEPTAEQARSQHRPTARFWFGFLGLNLLLFLPGYLFTVSDSVWLPQIDDRWATSLFVWRNNLDVFRLHLEWTLLVTVWVSWAGLRTGRFGRIYRLLAALGFVLAFAYAVYEMSMRTLYQSDPVFYSQYPFIRDGVAFVLDSLGIPTWLFVVGIGLVFLLLVGIGRMAYGVVGPVAAQLGRPSRIALWIVAGVSIAAALGLRGQLVSPKTVVQSFGFKLVENVSASAELQRQVNAFDATQPGVVYDYGEHSLLRTPNIYLIFIESYGSVLYKRDDWREGYSEIVTEHEELLASAGWHTASALSESPTWGGGSWMAYTSALFGLRVDSQPQYLALFDRYLQEPYPGLARTLQQQGYTHTWVSPIVSNISSVDWDAYAAFYSTDAWPKFADLDYQGRVYGWGPAPPDQYVLNLARADLLDITSGAPQLLFYITQNSHFPWAPQPRLVADWRSFQSDALVEVILERDPATLPGYELRALYLDAIEYQLDMLTDFILTAGNEDALFVLVGDHQPQRVSRREDGFDTPLHVISRDPALIEQFVAHGLQPGLLLDNPVATHKHEGLYSLIMNALLTQYGDGVKLPPPYLPDGLPLSDPVD